MSAISLNNPVMDVLIQKLKDENDEDHIAVLLEVFEKLDPSELPIPDLTEFLLTEDTDGDLWLIATDQAANWDNTYELVARGYEFIPVDAVVEALKKAYERSLPGAVYEEGQTNYLEKALEVVGLVDESFPLEELEPMLADAREEVRDFAVDTLSNINAHERIKPFLADPSADVRRTALQSLVSAKMLTIEQVQVIATGDADEGVRELAGKIAARMGEMQS